jgi:threonine dehydratase
VLDAHTRVQAHLRPLTLLESPALGRGSVLAIDTFQATGSFKIRGALAALSPLGAGSSVVTASAGNHGLAVAHAASLLDVDATVVVPENASSAKLAAFDGYRAALVRHGQSYDEAERRALRLATGSRRYVSAYNDRLVIAGQGTIGVELLKRIEGSLTILCPLGGGGLASGVALWATQRAGVRVVGVEVEASQAVSRSVAKGKVVRVALEQTLADGLAGNLEPGSITVDLVRRYVERIVSVCEQEVEQAMRFLVSEHGLIAEGAGAVGVAAMLAGKVQGEPGRTVALLTGRNVAADVLSRVLRGKAR